MNLSGKVGSRPEHLGRQRAAQAREPRADREGDREDAVTSMPRPRGDARASSTAGAQPAAEAGAGESTHCRPGRQRRADAR